VRYVRVESQQQRGAFLDESYPGVPVAMQAAFVPFGLAEPAFQVEIVFGEVCLLPPNTQPGGKARHHLAQVGPDRIVARVELRLQNLKLRLTRGACATIGFERRLERPHLVHMGSQSLLDVVHGRQPPCDVACSTGTALVSRPPFCASTCRWSEACTAAKAAAMRHPGGGSGPP
jgi:hypothetical protein